MTSSSFQSLFGISEDDYFEKLRGDKDAESARYEREFEALRRELMDDVGIKNQPFDRWPEFGEVIDDYVERLLKLRKRG